jgi:hypothetical protein
MSAMYNMAGVWAAASLGGRSFRFGLPAGSHTLDSQVTAPAAAPSGMDYAAVAAMARWRRRAARRCPAARCGRRRGRNLALFSILVNHNQSRRGATVAAIPIWYASTSLVTTKFSDRGAPASLDPRASLAALARQQIYMYYLQKWCLQSSASSTRRT